MIIIIINEQLNQYTIISYLKLVNYFWNFPFDILGYNWSQVTEAIESKKPRIRGRREGEVPYVLILPFNR